MSDRANDINKYAGDLPPTKRPGPAQIRKTPEEEEYVLANAYEEIVKNSVRSVMEYMDMCQCEKCFKDACALVLNQLQPHYVTTKKGTIYTRVPQMEMEKHANLTIKIAQALQMVREAPQH